jgi:type I restriction enzyme, S subunit
MSWKKVKLGDFLKVRTDKYKPNDIAIAHLKRIEKIDFSGKICISDKPSNTDMILVKKGDLVISGINVEKGAMNVYEGEEDITATIHYSSYQFDGNKLNIDFLKHFLKSIAFKNALKEQVPGGIKTEIKPKHLLPLVISIPTNLNDQKALVNELNNRNSKCEVLASEFKHQLDLVKKLRQQFLQEAVQGLLIPNTDDVAETGAALLKRIQLEKAKSGKKEKPLPPIKPEEIPFEIPENWVWCRLGEVVNHIFDGPFGSHLKSSDYTESGVQVIRLENLGEMKFKSEKLTFVSQEKYETISQHRVFKGDIIIGSFLADGVKCVVLPQLENIAIAKADCFCIRIKHNLLLNEYVKYLLSSNPMFAELSSLLRGMTRLRINTSQLKNLPIPLPPISVQAQLVPKLDELMRLCDGLTASIQTSQSQNAALLQQVLREALSK